MVNKSSYGTGPVFGRTATPVRVPRGARLRHVEEVFEQATDSPVVLVRGGSSSELPKELTELLSAAIHGAQQGELLTLVVGAPKDASPLTSQAAADLLNVSRPYVVKLAREGALPHTLVGNRHRFVLRDVLAYRAHLDKEREAALTRLVPVGGYVKGDF